MLLKANNVNGNEKKKKEEEIKGDRIKKKIECSPCATCSCVLVLRVPLP